MAQKDPTGGTDREEEGKSSVEMVDASVHSPALQEAEQEDEPSLGQKHWSTSTEVCDPESSDLCKQNTGLQGWGTARQRHDKGPSRNTLSSGAHGVKDPGDGAVAQHIWRLV